MKYNLNPIYTSPKSILKRKRISINNYKDIIQIPKLNKKKINIKKNIFLNKIGIKITKEANNLP